MDASEECPRTFAIQPDGSVLITYRCGQTVLIVPIAEGDNTTTGRVCSE